MLLDRARSGNWLDAARVRGYLWLLAAVNVAALLWLVLTASGGIDRNGFLLGTDYISFWAASRVLHGGGNVYEVAAHIAAQRQIYAGHAGYTAFYYPPVFLPICWPLGLIGYFPSLLVWLAVTGTAYALAVRQWLGRMPWLAMAAFAPVAATITHGQTSFLLASLLGMGVWFAARGKAVAAGVLLGLAVFKPQFGLLIPLVLICSRQWRVIAAAGSTALVVGGLTTLAFGAKIWSAWWEAIGPAQTAMTDGAIGFAKMQSLFSAARLLGIPAAGAWGLQLALALAVALTLAVLAVRRGLTLEVGAATLAGALLATPFVLDYDLTLLAFPLAVLARGDSLPWERTAGFAAFVVGEVARPLAMASGIAIAPVVIAVLFGLLVRRADGFARYEKGSGNPEPS